RLPILRVERGEVPRGQGLELETAAPGLDMSSLSVDPEFYQRVVRQRAADLVELARHHGAAAILALDVADPEAYLDFEIGTGDGQGTVLDTQEQVGEDRQRLAFLDHAGGQPKRFYQPAFFYFQIHDKSGKRMFIETPTPVDNWQDEIFSFVFKYLSRFSAVDNRGMNTCAPVGEMLASVDEFLPTGCPRLIR